MAADPFASSFAKIHRAHEHIQALARHADAFLGMKPEPYEIRTEQNADGWHIGRFYLRMPIPAEFSAIAGDAMHNARAVLDHAIYAVSLAPTKEREHVAFPLNGNRIEYLKAKDTGAWERALAGVDTKYRAVVERAQPYRRGNGLLGALRKFDNADKHRAIRVGIMRQAGPPVISVPVGRIKDLEFRHWSPGKRLRQGAEVWKWRAGRVTTPAVAVKIHFTPAIAFGERNLTIGMLQDIANQVANIILDLRRIAGEPDLSLYASKIGESTAILARRTPPPSP